MTTPFDPGDEPLTWHEEREHISEREQRVLDRLSRRAGIDMQSDRESLARWWDQLTAEQQAAAERASRHPEMADAILDAAQRARDGGPIEVPDRPLEREPSAAEWWPEVDQAEVTPRPPCS